MAEYGLLIERAVNYGTEYVTAHVVRREPNRDHPLGCNGDGIDEWSKDEPKHLRGLALDGLGLYGFVSDTDCAYIGHDLEYRDVYAMHLPKLERMARTMRRVLARIRKDAAYEPGDKFAAICAALKLAFVVERTTPCGQANPEWRWMTVAEGRNRFRTLIDAAQAEARERRGLPALAG